MRLVQMREFAARVAAALRSAERSGEPILLMRHARPVAFVVPVDSSIGQDLMFSFSREAAAILTVAERERVDKRGESWRRAEGSSWS